MFCGIFAQNMKYLISIISLFFALVVFAQGELDQQEKIFYRNERTFGFLLNSNGYGGSYRYGKRIDAFRKTLYEVEFNYLKHPKEIKISLPNYNRNIVYGKLNAAYTLKGAVGFQKELFQKRDQGGISIRYFVNIGPTLALLKPIYYEYIRSDNTTYYERFQAQASIYEFTGKAPYVEGINEIKIQPGLYSKIGLTFEYGSVDEIFHALELGLALDGYIGKVPIMETSPGKLLFVLPDDQFILTLFISYRFGKVIDTRFNPKQNKIDKIITE
jgi:hypothetical protein